MGGCNTPPVRFLWGDALPDVVVVWVGTPDAPVVVYPVRLADGVDGRTLADVLNGAVGVVV